jgi:hypothetical protein
MLLSRTKVALAAAGSILAVAAPVATASADNGVPQGHVLEFGRLTTISGSAGNDGTTFDKAFVTTTRGHEIVTDNGTGALQHENATSPRIWKAYSAADDTLTLRDGVSTPFAQTPAEEAKYFQLGVDQGCFIKVGSDNGLDHYKMIDHPQVPCSDDPDTKVDAEVDQRTGYVISRVTSNGPFKQSVSLAYVKDHTEPGRNALLRMSPHPGAKVIDDRS